MILDVDTIAKLVSPVMVAIIGVIATRYFEGKPKLISYLVHTSALPLLDKEITQVNTHSVVIRNIGKKSAHNVSIGHAYFPPSYQMFPPLNHEIRSGPSGAAEILIPVLVPNEQVSISYLYLHHQLGTT